MASTESTESSPRFKLGYWKIKGLAQPARLMFGYKQVPFVDETYQCGPAPDFDRSSWISAKAENAYGLDFPNLPYLIDSQDSTESPFTLTESGAIYGYLARELGIGAEYSKDSKSLAKIDQLAGVFKDFNTSFVRICYSKSFDTLKVAHLKEVAPKHLAKIEAVLSKTKQWSMGEYLTYPDFMLFCTLEAHMKLEPEILTEYPSVKNFYDSFLKIPSISSFYASNPCVKYDLNNMMASFK